MSFNSKTTGVTCGVEIFNPSGAPEFIPVFSGVRVTRSIVYYVMFCRSFFVPLSFFFGHCIVSFDLRLLITPLVLQTFIKKFELNSKSYFNGINN